ncbi:MAG TPA: hypothetical protein VG328_22075 [Stellaceae bacterium]|nr:hypothetical protein [Stellaceae bacterium]
MAAKDHDKGKHESPQAEQQQGHFDEHDRAAVRGYYENAVGRGHCPPGLAKKNNGCLPPGQAKKLWAVGRPLPPSVVYAPAPPALVVQLTPPPVGYRYIQVSGDILLIAAGSRMVADAITDLGR